MNVYLIILSMGLFACGSAKRGVQVQPKAPVRSDQSNQFIEDEDEDENDSQSKKKNSKINSCIQTIGEECLETKESTDDGDVVFTGHSILKNPKVSLLTNVTDPALVRVSISAEIIIGVNPCRANGVLPGLQSQLDENVLTVSPIIKVPEDVANRFCDPEKNFVYAEARISLDITKGKLKTIKFGNYESLGNEYIYKIE